MTRVALVNPAWSFDGSIYFGCREAHLPLELGYTRALLESAGHEVLLIDGQLGFAWQERAEPLGSLRAAIEAFAPDITAVTTAPSYLFWRCAPPELRVPMATLDEIRDVAGRTVIVGPHASTTPAATLRKLGADAGVIGECEDVVLALASVPSRRWHELPSLALRVGDHVTTSGPKNATAMRALPALAWPEAMLHAHAHHHHRFEAPPAGAGAEMEASRGCPYHCTFCAKENFRNDYRKRPLDRVLAELDGLVASGVRYVYFIDEIFLPDRKLLEALAERDIQFGVQLRIDNWTPAMLELLGRAGCVSIEGGMESITEHGRSLLQKHCKLTTAELTERFVVAKQHVPFVQANLLDATTDRPEDVAAWRTELNNHGVWSNEPVPLFPYPGSPEYALRFGACEDDAWERAHAHYLAQFGDFSDIQESRPRPLAELEGRHA